MQTMQGRRLSALIAVQQFLDEHEARLAGVATGEARKQLDAIVAQLAAHVADQSGSHFAAQSATKKQQALRQALLRDHMAPIARIAHADLPDTPEVQALKMPRTRPATQRLAALARGMARTAGAFPNVFQQGGLPRDFAERLNAAADAMLEAGQDRSRSRGRRGGATKGLKERLAAGRKVVWVLDALVKSAAANDPALLTQWNIVKRVQRMPSRTPAASLDARPHGV